MTEFDTPWKDALENYFEEFIAFFFPQAHRQIDWSQGFEFLDKELQQVVQDAELGKRLVDKLVKIYRHGGEEAWVLIHIEVQSQQESKFAERMFVYNYRIYDRYRRSVASLAVLGDESSKWRPNQFDYELFGCDVRFRFPAVKLLDYQQQWSALEASRNPFATVVMAHLTALETRSNNNQRLQSKLALTRRLYEQGFKRQDIINLFKFIDWVINLPKELQQRFDQQLSQYEEGLRMPYIINIERRAIRQGLLQGIELGLELKFGTSGLDLLSEINEIEDLKLLETIFNQLKTVSTLEHIRAIYQPSSQQEETKDIVRMPYVTRLERTGIRKGLLEGIELGLRLKFSSEGLEILPEISQIQDVEQLRAILTGLAEVNTVEELRQIYQPTI